MKNLNYSTIDGIDFFDNVLGSKRNSNKDPNYKERISSLRPNIVDSFAEFDEHFNNNNLISLDPVGYNGQNKEDLLKMYRYSNSVVQKLKTEVTTFQDNRTLNTCQNCTIDSVSTMDHLIPKDEFCEFSVNPKNLFPCCSYCNSIKNNVWREDNTTLFLNLYLDRLPNIQYLFVTVSYQNNVLDYDFSVDNRNNIEPELFNIIESHYLRLKLSERFKLESNEVVTSLVHDIETYKTLLNKASIINIVLEKNNKGRAVFGFNYWKAILQIALINHTPYLDSLLE